MLKYFSKNIESNLGLMGFIDTLIIHLTEVIQGSPGRWAYSSSEILSTFRRWEVYISSTLRLVHTGKINYGDFCSVPPASARSDVAALGLWSELEWTSLENHRQRWPTKGIDFQTSNLFFSLTTYPISTLFKPPFFLELF